MAEPSRFYITTAIDYPNGVPHMGHAYEKTVADFYARWYSLRGSETRFLTGLDEHGQKIQEAATEAGMSPQDFVDEKSINFRDLCEKLTISNDDFIRTSESRHRQFAAELCTKILDGCGCRHAFLHEMALDDGRVYSVHDAAKSRCLAR